MAKKAGKAKKKAKSKSKAKSLAGKPKSTKIGTKLGKPKFSSAKAVFDHLGNSLHRVTLTGALQKLDDEYHVAFTPNGNEWLALPVSSIDDAKLINRAASETAGLDCVEISVCFLRTISNAALEQMLRQNTFSQLNVAPPTSPPPVCQPGQVARWLEDHWECI